MTKESQLANDKGRRQVQREPANWSFGLRRSLAIRHSLFVIWTLAAWLFAGFSAVAQTNSAAATNPALSTPNLGVSLIRVMGALALVLGIFLGGVWLYRNWQRLAVRRGNLRKLDIMEVRPLGGRQAIYVVAYEQERFLLASSPAGVNFLTHLPTAEGEAETAEAKPVIPFSQALAQVLKGK